MTDGMVVPDVVGEIVGWRAWRVIGSNYKLPILGSVSHKSTVWHPGYWTHATCRGSETCQKARLGQDARVPGEGCSCGMYAARDRSQLVGLGYNRPQDADHPVFIGEVGLAGKVIPGTQGWRAEKGRVVRLYVPFHQHRYVDWLQRLYRVPVLLDNTMSRVPSEAVELQKGGE